MSHIMECDRCKRRETADGFAPPEIRAVSLAVGAMHPGSIATIDLCPDCIKAVREFMSTPIVRQA